MKRRLSRFIVYWPLLLAAMDPSGARAAISPEQEAARIAKRLRPIPDDQWKTIAGERAAQSYEIVGGDTLSEISKRLFGDARYWPKIWALNNDTITNPHLIRPGKAIAFLAGTGSSLPSIGIGDTASASDASSDYSGDSSGGGESRSSGRRSREWRALPRQRWENVPLALPPEVDAQGFDNRSRVRFGTSAGIDLEAIVASEELTMLGKITGSRSEGSSLTIGDSVYISADGQLQVGESYAITRDPLKLKSRESDRTGYSYQNLGRVKVIGVKDGIFVGMITVGHQTIIRGDQLMPLQPRVRKPTAIAGPQPLQGVLMIDKTLSSDTTAEHKLVFIDRGSDDGVQPGMVFRAYQHKDPSTQDKITDSDFIIDADILVMAVTPQFSSGLVIKSLSPVRQDSPVVLLTDISDLLKNKGFRERTGEEKAKDDELDQLDKLDQGDGLGKGEERELKQLENWEGNPPPGDPSAAPTEETPPPPIDGETPPPPPAEPPPPSEEPSVDGLPAPDEPPPADAPPPTAIEPEPAPPPPPSEPPPSSPSIPEDEALPPPPPPGEPPPA